jgi:uncharacterized protein
MPRVVFDANVWIPPYAYSGPIPRAVIDLARLERVDAVLSEPIIDQIPRTFGRFGWTSSAIQEAVSEIRDSAEIVAPAMVINAILEKSSDNRVLECAVTGRVDYIVSGDTKHLLRLGHYEGIPIVSPREFLRLFTRDFS